MKNLSVNTEGQRGEMAVGQKSLYPDSGVWVNRNSFARSRGHQTQLLFNLAMPASVHNRATSVGPAAPVVIEKLVSHSTRQGDGESCGSSVHLSVVSEERLQAAVRLAKRDLYRKRQESLNSPLHKSMARSISPDWNSSANHQSGFSPKGKPRIRSPKRRTKTCSEVLVYTPQKLPVTTLPDQGQSPPTRDPGLSGEPQLSREIHKLQKELATYIQRVEQLANKGRPEEAVEPEEKRRLEIRRQEQAARSSRIIYVLQRQVKEIQEDLDKLRSQSVRNTKKSRAVDRLAAAHRGAVRAMQVFINQLSDPVESRVPAQCKELGQLIRQLSLCSARVEVGRGSAVPEITLDILQKLENLDSALRKKEDLRETEPRLRCSTPVRESSSRARDLGTAPPRAPRTLTVKAPRVSCKPAALKKTYQGRRAAGRPQGGERLSDQERRVVLRAAVQSLVDQRKAERGSPAPGAALTDKSKQGGPVRDAGFQQATVSSRLRESQLPQREASVPWVPTSPHASTKQRAVSARPEPRCLFTPVKSSAQPAGVSAQAQSSTQEDTTAGSLTDAHHEALRHAWLDRVTEDRLRQLTQLTKKEMDHINKLRTEVLPPTPWAQETEEAARKRLQPLLDSAQAAAGVDGLNQALPGNLRAGLRAEERAVEVEQARSRLLQDPTLEHMLQRMEEMEKDQEEVRRRIATISYTDSQHWDTALGAQWSCDGSRPVSPQPIRLTKAVVKPSVTGDVVIQRPVESGRVSDEEESTPICSHQPPGRGAPAGGVRLSVPTRMLESIQGYREAHNSYLRLVAHEAVGGFDPWAVAESLAEELMTEALTDVAVEFQDVCEQYAEAIFTSEFLQPVQSPSPAVS